MKGKWKENDDITTQEVINIFKEVCGLCMLYRNDTKFGKKVRNLLIEFGKKKYAENNNLTK
jgi:hypothetical protein